MLSERKEKVLITGGLGNLGSWVLEFFCEKGYDVYVLARNRRVLVVDHSYHLILCDIGNTFEMSLKLKRLEFDYVIHLASYTEIEDPHYAKQALHVNVLGTRNLLNVLNPDSVKHFIYISTFQVYGRYEGEIRETDLCEPKNDYALTHLFAEQYVQMYGRTHGLKYSILRPTNGYGAPKDLNSSKWGLIINNLAKHVFEEQQISLNTNGKALRDYVWLGDICEVLYGLISKGPDNQVYNVSGEKTMSTLEVARAVEKVYMELFKREVVISINEDDKSAYPDNLSVSSDKLRVGFGYKPTNNLHLEVVNIFELLNSVKQEN